MVSKMLKYVSLLSIFVIFVSGIDLKCDLDNTISDSSQICVVSDIISNHEADEFVSFFNSPLYAEVVFKNSSLLKIPRELVQKNNIGSLRLERCGLKRIAPNTFNGVSMLWKLYLSGNRIESISKNMFDGLTSLLILDLSENKIKDVASNAFYGLDQLKHINLATNKLTTLSVALKSTYGLKIDVRDNIDLNAVDYVCDDVIEACSVLILDDNTIDLTCDAENEYVEYVCTLNEIKATKDAVGRLVQRWSDFGLGYYRSANLNTEYFKEIVFVNSTLYSVPTILFDYYVNLEYLNVSSCEIQVLNTFSFKNASILVDIDLSLNHITKVGPNVFDGAKELSVIDLSENRIETIDKHAFSMLNKLTSLLLNGNKLTTIDLDLRLNFPLVLNVSNCSSKLLRVTSASETYIIPYSSSVIDACNNELDVIDLIEDGPIVSLMLENNTGKFDLNNITRIKSLTTLSLRNASIDIKNGMFKNMPQLENLDLANTNLQLKYGLFGTGSKVKKLDLSNNNLKAVDFYKLGSLHELEEIILDGNDLLNVETFDVMMIFPHLKQISFLNNRFYCDSLVQTIIALEERGVQINYPNDFDTEDENNVNGIECIEYNHKDNGRDIVTEKQLDRLERTFLTIYSLKKAFLR